MAKTTISTDLSLDTTRFQRGIARSQNAVKRFTSTATAQVLKLGAAFAGIGLIKNIINLGTSAAETATKFDAVFGSAADRMNDRVLELKKTIPSTMQEMRDSLATVAQMARSFGIAESASNDFAIELIKLTGDMASFNNLTFEKAFSKIRSALSGEFVPLKQLGIVINETRIKQEGLNQGIWDGTGAVSAAQKALIVHNILIEDMGIAHGDAAETAGSAANKIKFLRAELIDLGTEIGTTALPAITDMTKGFAWAIEKVDKLSKSAGRLAGKLAFGSNKAGSVEDRVLRAQAKRELVSEGAISAKEPRGFFNRKAKQQRKQLIEDRFNLIKSQKESVNLEIQEEKAAARVNDEIEKQIELESDPARKQALKERVEAYEDLIRKVGTLNSQKSTSIRLTKEQKKAEELFKKGDKNRDGIITGREKRAKEREDRKKATEERRKRTAAIAAESRAPRNEVRSEVVDMGNNKKGSSRFVNGRKDSKIFDPLTFSDREIANGLSDTIPTQGLLPMQGPLPNERLSAHAKEMEAKSQESKEEKSLQYLESIDERLQSLENAIN